MFAQKKTTHTPWPFNRHSIFRNICTNCLLFDKALHNSWCLVLAFYYKVIWISSNFDCLMGKPGIKSEIKLSTSVRLQNAYWLWTTSHSHLWDKTQFALQNNFIFFFSNWSTNLQRTSHETNEKASVMKDSRDFFFSTDFLSQDIRHWF